MSVTENIWRVKVCLEAGSAKFFVKSNGETLVEDKGILNDREIRIIREFIKENYREMYLKWVEKSNTGFWGNH